jgi:hypothetical protein
MDDTKGFEGGFITTYLKKHLAISITAGGILPGKYKGDVPDMILGLPSTHTILHYGKAFQYSVSAGYLLFPQVYKNYKQPNINVYVELLGKAYGKAKVYFDNLGMPGNYYEVDISNVGVLQGGHYVEAHPGIQLILASNTRLELSVGFPIYSKSYAHYYPYYSFGLQHYLYPKTKHKN